MNRDILEFIAKLFIGDVDSGPYDYKEMSKIKKFYENHYQMAFDFPRIMGQVVKPSRKDAALEKMIEIYNKGKLNTFLTHIYSVEFFVSEGKTREESVDLLSNAISITNEKLREYHKILVNEKGSYSIKEINDELVGIGKGGFADVYLVKSKGIVLKKLMNEYMSSKSVTHRFKREYEITKNLNSVESVKDTIVEVFDFDDDEYCYTMELCEVTLTDYIKDNSLSEETKELLVMQILATMSDVHKENIIHRDLSPNNVMLKNGYVRICDFGLGKDFKEMYSHETNSTNGYGTPLFVSPEQFTKLQDGDKYSDVYSLGRIINFIFSGLAYDQNHKYKSVTYRATSLERLKRYSSAEELYEDFKKYRNGIERINLERTVVKKISEGILDDDVFSYLVNLNDEKFFLFVINEDYHIIRIFLEIVDSYQSKELPLVLGLLDSIVDSLGNGIEPKKFARGFDSLDRLLEVGTELIQGKFDYLIKEKSALILYRVANHYNRFNTKRKIDDLIAYGVEPLIEDILLEGN